MRLPLGRAYQGRSLIASAQRCVNLYTEYNNAQVSDAPVEVTLYPTPGFTTVMQPQNNATVVRCLYKTSIGTAYAVIGNTIYFITSTNVLIAIGNIADKPSQVYMADNGLVAVLVDGSNIGYAIDLLSNNFGIIADPSFLGASFVLYMDTFFIFNHPLTNQFYISLSEVSYQMLTGIAIGTGYISNPGSGYIVGLYQSVPLTGGSGTGATANVQIASGIIATGHISAAGSLYTNGFYPSVNLTGGAGTGATADITVSGGAVTSVVFTGANDLYGSGYLATDVLSASAANLGGTGSGFTYTVDTIINGVGGVTIINSGQNYLIGDILSASNANLGGTGTGFTFTMETFALAFDPLDIAAKSGSGDPIVSISTVQDQLWLEGALTTEIWTGTGAADFFYQRQQGALINHGNAAPFSIASIDILNFWLSQDLQGQAIIVQGANYQLTEISTPAIVAEIQTYSTISDAIGFCFQIADHAFYCLTFPTANKTWLYDLTSKEWSEWNWLDADGNLNRHRANCYMFAYNQNLIGDWQNGKIYALSINTFTDDGNPIPHIRTFPHLIHDGKKTTYQQFTADIECGLEDGILSLRWSDDRGRSYGNPVVQTMGNQGDYLTQANWSRLGIARDRVFELSWSSPVKTALNGTWLQVGKVSGN